MWCVLQAHELKVTTDPGSGFEKLPIALFYFKNYSGAYSKA